MPRNVRFTPRQRHALTPPAANGPGGAGHAVVIDDQAFWSGKDFQFAINNKGTFPRFYRVVVTNLSADTDYALFSQYGKLDPNTLIEVEPGGGYEISLVLGGDAEHEPDSPRQFQIYVQQFATRDESDAPKTLFDRMLKWIPKPDERSLYLTTAQEEIKVRPWKRRIQFDASLVNRSFLPVTADIRALPSDEGKAAGLEGASEKLREPVPAQTEQPVLVDVSLDRPLKQPVVLSVDAAVEIPDMGVTQTVPARTVRIVPVPLLRAWQDWLVLAGVLFLLVWALFGMPPVVHPTATLTIYFEGPLPANFDPAKAMAVVVKAVDDVGATIPDTTVRANHPSVNGNMVTYRIDWGWRFRGPRWSWNRSRLNIEIRPGEQPGMLAGYESKPHILRSQDGQRDVTYSMEYGVKPSQAAATLTRSLHVALLLTVDPAHAPSDNDINVEVRDNGVTVLTTKLQPGQPISIPDDKLGATNNISITATAGNGATASAGGTLQPQADPIPFALKFGIRNASVSIAAGDPQTPFRYVIKDNQGILKESDSPGGPVTEMVQARAKNVQVIVTASGKTVVNASFPISPDVPATVPPWKAPAAPELPPIGGGTVPPPITPVGGDNGHTVGGGGTNGGASRAHQGGGSSVAVQGAGGAVNKKRVEQWCQSINIFPAANAIYAAMNKPDALHLMVGKPLLSDGKTHLSVSADKKCWIQVYEIYSSGSVRERLGDNGEYVIGTGSERGWLITRPTSIDSDATDVVSYVVIAHAATEGADELAKNLVEYLDVKNATGWAIQGVNVH
jgi:hypothetical protein